MNICPYCRSQLREGADYCLVCGAAIKKNTSDMPTVTLHISSGEARRGCTCMLRYPGWSEPIKVRLPKKMYDGMVLYINQAKFYVNYGDVVTGPLRIVIRVKKKELSARPIIVLSVLSVLLLGWLLYLELRPVPAPPVEETPLPTQVLIQTPQPDPELIPTPTPTPVPLTAMQQKAAEMIPHFELRYYLNVLDDRLLENLCTMYSAVSNFETECSFPRSMTRDEFSNLALILSYECPELLQFSTGGEITFTTNPDGEVISAQLPIVLTRQEFAGQYSACAEKAIELARQAEGKSEREKEALAYDYLTGHCFYNFNGASASNAFGALGEGQAKCDGISLAMKWLLEEMNISCLVIAGNTETNPVGHAWNVVRIDGEYYDLDVTNDVLSRDRDYKYYGAYNVSRFWIREKYPCNVSFSGFIEIPGCLNMNESFHSEAGRFIYPGSDYEGILFAQLDTLADGEAAYLQFESIDDYHAFNNNVSSIMSRWKGRNRGGFSYSFAHLDEFQVCRITVSYYN